MLNFGTLEGRAAVGMCVRACVARNVEVQLGANCRFIPADLENEASEDNEAHVSILVRRSHLFGDHISSEKSEKMAKLAGCAWTLLSRLDSRMVSTCE